MTDPHRPPAEETPASSMPESEGAAPASTVRASPTEVMQEGHGAAPPQPATPFEAAPATSTQQVPPVAADGLPAFVSPPSAPAPNTVAGSPAPVSEASPAEMPAQTGTAAAQVTAPAPSPEVEVPASGGLSPWHKEEELDASLLPSANLEAVTAGPEVPQSTKPESSKRTERAHRSRSALVVGLAVAAVLLVATMIYIGTRSSNSDDGPASVRLGSDGTELGLDPDEATSVAPSAEASADSSASAAPATPYPYGRGRLPRSASTGTKVRFVPDDL